MRYGESVIKDKKGKIILKSFFSTIPVGKREYREHRHTECELSTFISGSGIYRVGGKEYTFSAGDVFLFGGDESHCITDITSPFKLLNLHFSPGLLWKEPEALSILSLFFSRNKNFENKIDRSNPCTQKIRDDIFSTEKELSSKAEGSVVMAKYSLFSALISLVRNYDYIDAKNGYTSLKGILKPMEAALSYIDENLTAPLTLEEIAAKASVSKNYFCAVFKKLNGVSPWEYITVKRIEKAVELLKTTDMTKLDIAFTCGFSSSSNFYKAFKSITGKSPSEIRK